MRRKMKSVVATLLTSVMVLGMAGCSNEKSNDTTSTTKETKKAESEAEESAEATDETETGGGKDSASSGETGIDSWTAFEDKVTITVPVYDRSKEGYPAVDDNYWTQWVQSEFGDKYNIEVKYVAIPRGDVMTKYSMLIASGDTPTIMMEYDYPKVAQWASDGAMQAIDLKEFSKVAPNYYQKMVENDQVQYSAINDETFFVLSERPYYDTEYTWVGFVRKDWLDQLDLEIPTNYEEHSAAVHAIMEAGIAGHPIGLSLPTSAYVTNFSFREFPVDEAEWAMHSSLGTASLGWEPTYQLLKRQNAEYNQGWFSPEYDLDADGSSGNSSSQQKTDFINGELYTYAGYMSSSVDWLTAFYEQNPDAELAIASPYVLEEPGVVDQVVNRAGNSFGMIVGFSSYADQDQLTAAWMLMEWMSQEDVLFTIENGIEGVTYTLDENGLPVVDADYRGTEMLNHNNNIDMTCLVHALKTIGTIEDTIAATAPQGLPQDFEQMMLDNYYEMKKIADSGRAYTDPVFSIEIPAEAEYSATLLSLYQEYSVALTKCAPEEFDALYEKLSQKYLDAGYQEVIDARLEAYEAGYTTKLPK